MADVFAALQKLPTMCATVDPMGKPIMLKRGVSGYWPLRDGFDVDGFNARHGVTSAQVEAMTIGSMFGWDVPGADPDYPCETRVPECEDGEKSGAYIRRLITLGIDADSILEAVHAQFAGSKATKADVSWNKSKLKKEGWTAEAAVTV